MLQVKPGSLLFGGLVNNIYKLFTGTHNNSRDMSSDSASMYILVFVLLILGIVLSLVLSMFETWKRNRDKVIVVFRKVIVYYLALQLLKYGFDKVFKGQFYMPEPNILYTPFGQMDKDILFWSTMGTSYIYCVLTGLAEVLAAICLLFRRSRVVGLLLSVMLLLHVMAINAGFDISVKLFTLLLLFMSLLLLSPQFGRLYRFLVGQETEVLRREDYTFPIVYHAFVRISLKSFIIGLFFLEALYPVFRSGQLNDDKAQRPFMHGAYEVFEVSNGTVPVELCRSPVRRIFIHRNGYMIFQGTDDKMEDYKLQVDVLNGRFILQNYRLERKVMTYSWDPRMGMLVVRTSAKDGNLTMKARALKWKNLPALQDKFHWTVDEVGVKRP